MIPYSHNHSTSARTRGFTLVETMVALGLGTLVLTYVMVLFVTSLANFTGLGNYSILTGQSRVALDLLSRDIREATQIVGCQTNLSVVTLTLTNAFEGTTVAYNWNPTTAVLSCDKTGQPTRFLLTGCNSWTFSFYQRTPNNSWTFFPTTDLTQCKLINMSWKCSRTVVGQRKNTENVTTAEVVLRNKP
jgi:prepilin-type N-terminal cleavage/methylation domain-containing protein